MTGEGPAAVDPPMSSRVTSQDRTVASGERAPSRRWRWVLAALLSTGVLIGAALGAIDASGAGPLHVLAVSRPELPDRHTTSVAPTGPATPTPAQVGRPAPSQVDPERPLKITLDSGTTMRVRRSATSPSGSLDIPTDIKQAGWWDGSSRLGDPFGAIVIAAHVDSFTQGLGRFAQLLSMKPGDVISLASASLSSRFTVVAAGLVPKASISPNSDLFSAAGTSRLVLITCGGQYDPAHGGYQSNMVVVAVAQKRAEPIR